MSVFLTEAPGKKTPNAKSLLRTALRSDDAEILRAALKQFKESSEYDTEILDESLINAVKGGKSVSIMPLIEAGAHPNCGSFRTPLQWALMLGKDDCATALINGGADVNFGNPPPITIAASMGRTTAVNLMLQRDVNVSAEVFQAFPMSNFLS